MEKKKMLKWILIGCGVFLVILLIVILLGKGTGEEVISSKPLNERINLEHVFAEIKKIDGMKMQGVEEDIIDEEEYIQKIESKPVIPEEEIDFGKYNVLEKKAIVYTTDDEINEVWMIKLSEYSQQEEISRILGNRIRKLKNAFEGNEQQEAILSNAIIKQEDAIVIMIISDFGNEIERTIAKAME